MVDRRKFIKQIGAIVVGGVGASMLVVRNKNVFYVGDGGIDAIGYGCDFDHPFATVGYAVNQCTVNQGNTICVIPGSCSRNS